MAHKVSDEGGPVMVDFIRTVINAGCGAVAAKNVPRDDVKARRRVGREPGIAAPVAEVVIQDGAALVS